MLPFLQCPKNRDRLLKDQSLLWMTTHNINVLTVESTDMVHLLLSLSVSQYRGYVLSTWKGVPKYDEHHKGHTGERCRKHGQHMSRQRPLFPLRILNASLTLQRPSIFCRAPASQEPHNHSSVSSQLWMPETEYSVLLQQTVQRDTSHVSIGISLDLFSADDLWFIVE